MPPVPTYPVPCHLAGNLPPATPSVPRSPDPRRFFLPPIAARPGESSTADEARFRRREIASSNFDRATKAKALAADHRARQAVLIRMRPLETARSRALLKRHSSFDIKRTRIRPMKVAEFSAVLKIPEFAFEIIIARLISRRTARIARARARARERESRLGRLTTRGGTPSLRSWPTVRDDRNATA